jgi:thiamine-phosphate diphosphorylase
MKTIDFKYRLAGYLLLYVVTDERLSRGRPDHEVAALAVAGGAGVIQMRVKHASTRMLLQRAGAIKRELDGRAIFIVNDRVDVALAVDADGVHLGQDDMPLRMARDMLGPDKIIGVSVSCVEEALAAEAGGADYLGASAVFSTATKADAEAMGLNGLRAVCGSVGIPVVGIGGINRHNSRQVMAAGAAGVAVVSAVVSATDITRAASELLAEIKKQTG